MSNIYKNYNELNIIACGMEIDTIQEINKKIKSRKVPIMDRINAINLLRELLKSDEVLFDLFFYSIMQRFINNCLNEEDNQSLQKISLLFIKELLNENRENFPNEFITNLFPELLKFYLGKNETLKKMAKDDIFTMSKNVVCNAKISELLLSLKSRYNDNDFVPFIIECIRTSILSEQKYFELNFSFEYILDDLNLDTINDPPQYLALIKNCFSLFKQNLNKQQLDYMIEQTDKRYLDLLNKLLE